MIQHPQPADHIRNSLGSPGVALATRRLSDFGADCLTCGQPLEGRPVGFATLVRRDHTAVLAHHASCPAPDLSAAAQYETTHMITPLAMGAAPILVVHPSLEVVWLSRTTGRRPRWTDTTATAFTELGFAVPEPDPDGPGFVFPDTVPDAGLWISPDVLHVDVPPSVHWSIQVPRYVTTEIAGYGGAVVVVTTALDHRELTGDAVSHLLESCSDYVAGFVEYTTGPRLTRSTAIELNHPMLIGVAQPTAARALFLDDPDLDLELVMVSPEHGLQAAGQDTDRLPVLVFEPTAAVLAPDHQTDLNVEHLVGRGLPRLTPGQLTEVPHWRVTYQAGQMALRDATGIIQAEDTMTPPPEWRSAAMGHGHVLVLYGPLLGVRRDDSSAELTPRAEFEHSLAAGLVAGAIVPFEQVSAR